MIVKVMLLGTFATMIAIGAGLVWDWQWWNTAVASAGLFAMLLAIIGEATKEGREQ